MLLSQALLVTTGCAPKGRSSAVQADLLATRASRMASEQARTSIDLVR